MAGAGVSSGDRVIVHVTKGIFELAATLAAATIGAIVVNVNVQWTAEQLAHVAADREARALIATVGSPADRASLGVESVAAGRMG